MDVSGGGGVVGGGTGMSRIVAADSVGAGVAGCGGLVWPGAGAQGGMDGFGLGG